MKRTPIRRGRGNPIPAASRKAVHARSEGRCEANYVPWCSGIGEHIHHVVRRREGGHDPSVLLHCCRRCHEAVHRYPANAREAGLIRSAVAS